jgi:FixJ family two-component response regulator
MIMKSRVFVVDDDASVRKALSRLLRSAGLEVRTFGSVDEFLDNVKDEESGVVISDVEMPGRSGLDLQWHLKEHGPRLPVILMTAHNSIQVRETAIRRGAIRFLQKPIHDEALFDAIDTALSG